MTPIIHVRSGFFLFSFSFVFVWFALVFSFNGFHIIIDENRRTNFYQKLSTRNHELLTPAI